MHEIHDIEFDLWDDAERLSKKYGGAPVVIIVAGDASADVGRCMLSSTLHTGARLRDLLGLLETAKQIESLKHFRIGAFGRKMQETEDRRRERAHIRANISLEATPSSAPQGKRLVASTEIASSLTKS